MLWPKFKKFIWFMVDIGMMNGGTPHPIPQQQFIHNDITVLFIGEMECVHILCLLVIPPNSKVQ